MAPESKPPIARIAGTSSCPPMEIYAAREPRRAVSPPSPKFKHRILETIELRTDDFAPCKISTSQRLMRIGRVITALCPERERAPLHIQGKKILSGEEKIGSVLRPGAENEKLKVWLDWLNPGPKEKNAPLSSVLPITVLPLHFQATYTKLIVSSAMAKFAAIVYCAKKDDVFLEFYISKQGSPIVAFRQF